MTGSRAASEPLGFSHSPRSAWREWGDEREIETLHFGLLRARLGGWELKFLILSLGLAIS